jgi:hypothetical protein
MAASIYTGVIHHTGSSYRITLTVTSYIVLIKAYGTMNYVTPWSRVIEKDVGVQLSKKLFFKETDTVAYQIAVLSVVTSCRVIDVC